MGQFTSGAHYYGKIHIWDHSGGNYNWGSKTCMD